MAYVTIRIKGQEGYTRVALGKDRNVVGRLSATEVPIKHTSISREHFAMVREGSAWFLEDLGSANGTRLNKGDRIAGRVALSARDIIKAGAARLTFHIEDMKSGDAAIDLKLDDEEGGSSDSTSRRSADEPHEATRCPACRTWLSIAHRTAGDHFACPRCTVEVTVPALAG